MKKLIIAVAVFMSFAACKKNNQDLTTICVSPGEAVPACILEKLDEYKKNSLSPGGLMELDEYLYQGKIVYYFSINGAADAPSFIMPNDCGTPCYIGGYTIGPASGMCNGEIFFDKAVLKRVIWKR